MPSTDLEQIRIGGIPSILLSSSSRKLADATIQSIDILDSFLQVTMSIFIPDMFVSFMASSAKVNPHIDKVREESESWLSRYVPLVYL